MSLLIRGGFIVDGTGRKPYRGDVLIREGKIVACEKMSEYRAEKTVEANNLFVSPGFVDVDSRSDFISSFFKDRNQEYYLKQGVTTVVLGHSGASIAPMFSFQEEVLKTWGAGGMNFNWDSFLEMEERLEEKRFGINFYSLAGQANIRDAVLDISEGREATENETRVMRQLARKCLENGAIGISFGPSFEYAKINPVSESRVVLEEVFSLNKIASLDLKGTDEEEKKKIISFFLREERRMGKRGKVFLRQIEKEEAEWLKRGRSMNETTASFNPSGYEIFPTRFLVDKRLRGEKEEELKRRIEEGENILTEDFEEWEASILDDFSKNKHFEGKSIRSIGNNKKERGEKLMRIMKEIKFRGVFVGRKKRKKENLLSEKNIFLSAVANLKETENTFSDFIKESLKEGEEIEKVVEKITKAPAEAMGLKNGAEIRDGLEGNITVFNRGGEIKYVAVGGRLAIDNEKVTGEFGGKIRKAGDVSEKKKRRWF